MNPEDRILYDAAHHGVDAGLEWDPAHDAELQERLIRHYNENLTPKPAETFERLQEKCEAWARNPSNPEPDFEELRFAFTHTKLWDQYSDGPEFRSDEDLDKLTLEQLKKLRLKLLKFPPIFPTARYLLPRVCTRIAQRSATGKARLKKEAENYSRFWDALFKGYTKGGRDGSSYEKAIDVTAIPEQYALLKILGLQTLARTLNVDEVGDMFDVHRVKNKRGHESMFYFRCIWKRHPGFVSQEQVATSDVSLSFDVPEQNMEGRTRQALSGQHTRDEVLSCAALALQVHLQVRLAKADKRCCVRCLKTDVDSSEKFKTCAGCKLVYYCTRECQRAHWPAHKLDCQRAKQGQASSSSAAPTAVTRSVPVSELPIMQAVMRATAAIRDRVGSKHNLVIDAMLNTKRVSVTSNVAAATATNPTPASSASAAPPRAATNTDNSTASSRPPNAGHSADDVD